MEGSKDSAFTKWLLEKDERFYILFLVATFIFFGALSMLNFTLIAGLIIAGFWLIFYFAIIKRR